MSYFVAERYKSEYFDLTLQRRKQQPLYTHAKSIYFVLLGQQRRFIYLYKHPHY